MVSLTEAEKLELEYKAASFKKGAVQVVKDMLERGIYDLDEIENELNEYAFLEALESVFPSYETPDALGYADRFDWLFDPKNFLSCPVGNKGTWIRIHTDQGFELHFAKRTKGSPRNALRNALVFQFGKDGFENDNPGEVDEDVLAALKQSMGKGYKQMYDTRFNMLENAVKKFQIFKPEHQLKFATIRVGKRKSAYLLPTQYDIPEDDLVNELFIRAASSPHLKFVQYFQRQDIDDQVFYMQSRGISKEQAQILANRQGGFLRVNSDAIMDQPDHRVRIVRKEAQGLTEE